MLYALKLEPNKTTLLSKTGTETLMNILVILLPIALFLGTLGLAGFIWSMKSGQFDDLEGAGWRAIMDDDDPLDPNRHSQS